MPARQLPNEPITPTASPLNQGFLGATWAQHLLGSLAPGTQAPLPLPNLPCQGCRHGRCSILSRCSGFMGNISEYKVWTNHQCFSPQKTVRRDLQPAYHTGKKEHSLKITKN